MTIDASLTLAQRAVFTHTKIERAYWIHFVQEYIYYIIIILIRDYVNRHSYLVIITVLKFEAENSYATSY